jgi:predicted PurR-regulated permease PerM
VSAENLLEVAVRTVRSVAQGVIGTAIIQGFLSGVGFLIAGVPFAIALGVLSFGTAMLQIGTWLVWIPVATWLFHQGETGWALFTSLLGIIINVLDNARLSDTGTSFSTASGDSWRPSKRSMGGSSSAGRQH